MARPQPLTNITSARSDTSNHRVLTPRTPHSRSGRAEEAYTEFELQQQNGLDGDDDVNQIQHQTMPLLSSSASDNFPTTGYRSRGDDYDSRNRWTKGTEGIGMQMNTVWSRIPLVLGSMLACFLLFLIFLSYDRPEKLHQYLGILPTNESSTSTTASHKSSHNVPSTSMNPHLVISYENYTTFPLRPLEYLAECGKLNKGFMSHGNYWEPHAMGVKDVLHFDNEDDEICSSTITYMLSGKVGLLADLALLAQVAALARERNRTFFIDDTYWNRGKWTDHFLDVRHLQPGPEPNCKPPPPEELVACPRLARHWVVNSYTAKFHLGHSYSNNYEDPYGHNLNRLKPQFKFAEYSLLNTIRPNKENAALIRRARSELLSSISPDGTSFISYIAVHLRRGDRQPSFYRGSYVPTENFVQSVSQSWKRLNPDKSLDNLSIYVASDSISAYREVVSLTAARYTTFSLFESKDPDLQALASPEEYFQKKFNEWEESARIRATRGMIVDFALISGSWADQGDALPAAVVCTISSNVCKLAAVGLGWEAAFGDVDDMGRIDDEHKRWVEIDQNGMVVPVWLPFELF